MPFERTITKSDTFDQSTDTSPCTTSSNVLTPSSGVRNRIGPRPAGGPHRVALLGRGEIAAPAVVAGRATGRERVVVALLDLVLGAVALVGRTGLDQAVGRGEIRLEPMALQHGALVPVEAEPLQHLLDLVDRLLRRPGHVGVLDAQDERAGGVARVQPVEERRPRVPDVQEAGGRGREPHANLGHRSRFYGPVPP